MPALNRDDMTWSVASHTIITTKSYAFHSKERRQVAVSLRGGKKQNPSQETGSLYRNIYHVTIREKRG